MTAAALTFFPDTTGHPRVYRLLRAVCEPVGHELDQIPGVEDIQPLGEVLEYVINAKMTCQFADWLGRHDHTAGMPRPMLQFLRGQLRLNAYRSRVHHREAAQIIAALQDRGVPAAAINGIAHASLLYSGTGVRQSSDVDILIPAASTTTATDVLTHRGYHRTGRRPTTLHRDLGDPIVPGLTLDLTTRLAHTDDDAHVQAILSRRIPAPDQRAGSDPLPILLRDDGFLHTLARVDAQRRWPALGDALRYAVDGTNRPEPAVPLPAAAQAGWDIVRACWPQLPRTPPLSPQAEGLR